MSEGPLTIGFPFAGDQYGGSSVSSLLLAGALRDRGHNVNMIVHGDGRMTEAVEQAGFRPHRLPSLSRVATDARAHRFQLDQTRAFGACRRTIGELGLQLVHVNDLAMLRTWAGPTRLSPARLIKHWRSNYSRSLSVNASLFLADQLIVISRYSQDRLPSWIQAKGVIEYNPIDQRLTDPADRARKRREKLAALGVDPASKVIGVFGSHIQRKRTHVLADVLHALPEIDGVPVVGVAFGKREEPYDTLLDEKIEAHHLESRLLRPGYVSPAGDWMAACDVVLAPAEREPFGRTAFEAVQAGAPIVMSSDSGAAELIKDGTTGYLADPHDIETWIARTRDLLANPALAANVVAEARKTLADLSPAKHAGRVEEIYRQVLSRRR